MNQLIELVILGAGGHGRETLDIVEAINKIQPTFHFLGFVDDGIVNLDLLKKQNGKIIGDHTSILEQGINYILGIGDPGTRRILDEKIENYAQPRTLVHPLASIGSNVHLDRGVILAAGARITTNVKIGRHTHLNVNSVVSHDCQVGDFVNISPGALINGNVQIEDDVLIGTGAIILPGCHIGCGAIVGAGAVVIGDVPPHTTVVGVPARPHLIQSNH